MIYQSRYGLHPCSPEVYRKLKRLNYLRLQAEMEFKREQRYLNKAERNRVIKKFIKNDKGQKVSEEVVGPMREPIPCTSVSFGNIQMDYYYAKTPVQTPAEIHPISLSEHEIDKKLFQAEIWFESVCKSMYNMHNR